MNFNWVDGIVGTVAGAFITAGIAIWLHFRLSRTATTTMNENYSYLEWLENIRCMLREFSDDDYQDRVWVKEEGPEVSGYNDAICGLFDDYGFDEFLSFSSDQYLISKKQIRALEIFRDAINEFNDTQPRESDEQIVQKPCWAEIRAKASAALSTLQRIC